MKQFEMVYRFFPAEPIKFNEETAPDWLTSVNTIRGSTMDNRWFWVNHCLTLAIGESVDTEYRTIRRTA